MMQQNQKCCLPVKVHEAFNRKVSNSVSRGVALRSKRWAVGETIRWWSEPHEDKRYVAAAFDKWKIYANLDFVEVEDISQSDIRVRYDYSLGSWSYLGTDAKQFRGEETTLNIGWRLSANDPTAAHEVGHAIGMAHEHQSPKRTIRFDVDQLYTDFAGYGWSRQDIDTNIVDTLMTDDATEYDTSSIMHYSFPGSQILAPEPYATNGVGVNVDISMRDVEWAEKAYPSSLTAEAGLEPMELHLLDTARVDTVFVLSGVSGPISYAVIGEGARRVVVVKDGRGLSNSRFVNGTQNLSDASSVVLGEFTAESDCTYNVFVNSFEKDPGSFIFWEGEL